MIKLEPSTCSPQSSRRLSRRFAALGDEIRLQMLQALLDAPATCTELARRFHCRLSEAWQRLYTLCSAGFVEKHGRGKGALYIAQAEQVNAFLASAASYLNAERPGLS